jgi:hypothetical protein
MSKRKIEGSTFPETSRTGDQYRRRHWSKPSYGRRFTKLCNLFLRNTVQYYFYETCGSSLKGDSSTPRTHDNDRQNEAVSRSIAAAGRTRARFRWLLEPDPRIRPHQILMIVFESAVHLRG